MERWATFDCYGTLIDWNAGIGAQLERLLGGSRDELLSRYHDVEPLVQSARPGASYREVMAAVLAELAAERTSTCRSPSATPSGPRCRSGRRSLTCARVWRSASAAAGSSLR